MARNYCISAKGATIYIDGKSYLFNDAHPNYFRAIEAARKKRWDDVPGLVDFGKIIATFSQGLMTYEKGVLRYEGTRLSENTYVIQKLLDLIHEERDFKPLWNFVENLQQNPSQASREELFQFLEACSLPLTEDGCFLAYKKVRSNYMDLHTGKISNAVGQVVTMPREDVDDNRHRTCSHGLHVCSKEYLKQYSSDKPTVICKVNPRDVVSVPTDYNNTKMRVCRYEVIDEIIEGRIQEFEAEPVFDEAKPKGFWSHLREAFPFF